MQVMPNFLIKRAFLTPDRTAVYFNNEELSFKELYECARKTAGQFQQFGLKKADFAAVLLKNHLDTVVILFALQLLGAKAVILNNRLTPAELSWQLKDSHSAFLVLESDFEAVLNEIPQSIKTITKEKLFAAPIAEPAIQAEIDLNGVCTIMYTSGTTGNPKGVLQTYGNHWWSSIGSALNLGFMEKDCWLCTVPLFHISGYSILMRSVIYGMPIVLHERFDVNKTIEDIQAKKVTIMSVVSTMLSKIVDHLDHTSLPQHFRCMLLGGGPAPRPLLEACVGKNIPVFQSYGMTETASQIVTLSPEYSLSRLGSAGKPLFPSQLKIVLEDGREAIAGEAGEIVVKGPNVTAGYLFRPDATKEKLKDGWLYTGDVGYVEEDGFLFVLDRRADLIISGGENIYPAEIEAALLGYEKIVDAGVIGIADEVWGQVPAAFVVTKNGCAVTAEELSQFCSERLAKYKIPKEFVFVEKLPRNAAKKLLRRKLQEDWEKGGTRS
ncbi:o-succinylbenzoate--CoA ligase [Neobacillus sp. SM06]|uniref:o-succinylbenzoate--CoA ligase n=1 Tax=Neobacillus sp. SM06 TaxID=3422492 RepID=UPI003D2A5B9F